MHPMRAVLKLDLSNRDQNALPIRREYRNFLTNHNLETTWTECTSSPSTRKYHAFVVVLIFNAGGITLKQDTFTTDMSKLAANFGGGKQFNKLTSNSTNICVAQKRRLSCVCSSIPWLNQNGNFYFLRFISFLSKPTLFKKVPKDENINFTQSCVYV